MRPVPRDEYERMFRVIDQSLTAHSILRRRYQVRNRSLTLLIVILSAGATAFTFADLDESFSILGLTWALNRWIGLLGLAIFILGLIDLVVDWRRSEWAHSDAYRRLAELKNRFRGVFMRDDSVESESDDLVAEYQRVMTTIEPIPDRQFNSLKARHYRKVALSRLITERPGAPLGYLWVLSMVHRVRADKDAKPASGSSEPDV